MTDIVDVPAPAEVPPYPQIGQEGFGRMAYDVGTEMPNVVANVNATALSARTNALAARDAASSAVQSVGAAAFESDAAMSYRNQAAASAAAAVGSASTAADAALTAGVALSSMQLLYLGAKTAVPTANNTGGALSIGCWYTYIGSDPALKGWYWWDGGAWQLGVGDVGNSFISKLAGVFDGAVAMSAAGAQSYGIYAAAGGAHNADWPSYKPAESVAWVVSTMGDGARLVQHAQLSSAASVEFTRSKSGSTWSAWARVVTDLAFVERVKTQAVAGGSGVSVTLDASEASIHVLTLTAGALTINLATPRQLGDQITVRILSSGGAWPLTFGASIKLPTGTMPTYSAGQYLTLTFVSLRDGLWDAFYSGVHA